MNRRHYSELNTVAGGGLALAIGLLLLPAPAAAEFFVPRSLGGSVSYGYGYSRSENTEMERTSLNLELNGNGYFWEPWFVTLGAGIGVGLSETVTNPGGGGRSTGLSGNMDFTVFPVSRFPLQVGFSITDSEAEQVGTSIGPATQTESRRFYIRQQYSSPGTFRMLAHFNQIQSISGDGKDSISNNFGIDASQRQAYQTFHGGVSFSEIRMDQPSRVGSDTSVFFNHSYLPGPDLGVISVLGYATSRFEASGMSATESSSAQGSSSFYWRPEDRPFYVSGGLRVVKLESAGGPETRSAGTNINASYNYSRNTRFLLGIAANATDSGGSQTTTLSENLSANYNSDPHRILRMDWSWSAGLGAGNSNRSQDKTSTTTTTTTTGTAEPADNVQSASMSLGHRLSKAWILTKYNTMNLNLGQGGSAARTSTEDDPTYSLNQGASLSWNRAAPGAQTSAMVQYSDNRSMGASDTVFDSVTFQLGRQQTINRLSSMSGSFNYQKSETTTDTVDNTDPLNPVSVTTHSESTSGSASLGYNHTRFLGIYRLNFSSTLTTRDLLRSSSGTNTAASDEIKLDWRNNFTYNIGLLSMALNINVTDTGGEHRAWSAFFRATRSF